MKLKDGVPCNHAGCLNHVTHPCEGCGRIAGKAVRKRCADPRELKEIAKSLQDGGMRCNCDLDRWQPEIATGHSCVCRIHKRAMTMKFRPHDLKHGVPSKTD